MGFSEQYQNAPRHQKYWDLAPRSAQNHLNSSTLKVSQDNHSEYADTKHYVIEKFQALKKTNKRYGCDQCSYDSSHKGRLDKHINYVHLKIKDFCCDECNYTCSEKSNL